MSAGLLFSRRRAMLMPLAVPLALSACKPRDEVLRLTGLTMGTSYTIVAIDRSGTVTPSALQRAVDMALDTVDRRMSNWRADSEISQFNAATSLQTVEISSELDEVMQAAEDIHHASLGRFDTTMGPLIELWGFGAPGTQGMPSATEIAAQQERSGHGNTLKIGGRALRKTRSDAQVYLAGIGKGYGADLVARNIENLGISDYMVEIGGDLYASGRNPDEQPWQIGIETPDAGDRSVFDVVALSGKGLATSGDYRNYFEQDGQRYSHLIDPTTGRPVRHETVSATVLADNAMLADAWSTAMLVLGREAGLAVADQHGVAVQFIERDMAGAGFTTQASAAFKALTA